MKVLSISTDRDIFKEGSAVRARMVEYASLFDELHIIVFTRLKIKDLRFKEEKIAKNVWVYPTNSANRWFYIFDAIRIGATIIKKSGFESFNAVVTAQDPFESGFVASKLAKRFKLPLHIQIHTDFLSPYFVSSSILNRIRVYIAKRVLPQANAVRVVSQRIKNSLSQIKCQMSKVSVLPIYTDIEKFENATPTFDLKKKYPQWRFIILAVGRLTVEKNFSFALKILRKLIKKYPMIGLVIVGDGLMRARLNRQARSAGLTNHVAFENRQSDLSAYYKTANLFLQTSFYEGFGLALLEAVASGLPAVSTDVGIAPELLKYNSHSFVCEPGDLKCFTDKISEFIEKNQTRTFFSTQVAPSVILPFIQTKEAYLSAYKASIESALTAFPK